MMIDKGALAALMLLSPLAQAADGVPYQPFPAGYGYLDKAEIAALTKAVRAGDHAVVRRHGWSLWAGIMQPARQLESWPVWYSWPNTTAAFALGRNAALEARPAGGFPLILRNRLRQGLAPAGNAIPVNVKEVPDYPVPQAVKTAYPKATSQCVSSDAPNAICDGAHFQSNGDILVATESLSRQGFEWIRDPARPLYKQSTLDALHKRKMHDLDAPQAYVVTKHMFWPVKAGQMSAVPVWHDYRAPDYPDYAGYETWTDLVAIDPAGQSVGQTVSVSYLHNIFQYDGTTPWPTRTAQAKVYGLGDFYSHQVTQADWDSFDEADKAILNASSYWAYDKPFGPGDYLVTIAMHVNTKEIPSWALQSMWWSDRPDSGPYAADRPSLPQAKGPWTHYLMADSYGIPTAPGGGQPVAMNPYIELVSHPVGTNCNTCHNRAGWPLGANKGQASYQNPDCPDALASLSPKSACLKPLTLTDFQWIIPDRAK